MVQRKEYLSKLKKWKDHQVIKVVTGVRRCGKSTLLLQFQDYLRKCGVKEEQIIAVNLEDLEFEKLQDYHKLYTYVCERLRPEQMTYVFLDEIQVVEQFQKVVDSLLIKKNVDVYITGSNAHMLSGELATLLSGRYIEIQMLPLSFAEYYELTGVDKKEAFKQYFQNGGFPYAAMLETADIRRDYLTGVYNTVLLKDVVARKRISDVAMLESIIKFLFDNVGNTVSSKKIADSLTSYGRKTTSVTVENYIEALRELIYCTRQGVMILRENSI